MIEQQLDIDLKTALLSGQKTAATTIRGLKSTLLYAKVAARTRDILPDEQVVDIFRREAKKRQESADLFSQGGNEERAHAELVEKALIEAYLPLQMDDAAIRVIIEDVISNFDESDMSVMGKLIGAVKAKTGASADGAAVARLVKERLQL